MSKRKLTTSYLLRAPEEDLDATLEVALERNAWLLYFEHSDAMERATGKPYTADYKYQREAALTAWRESQVQ